MRKTHGGGVRPDWRTLYGRLMWIVDTFGDGVMQNISTELHVDRKQFGVQVGRTEKGGELSVKTYRKLKKRFGLTWDWLLDGVGPPLPPKDDGRDESVPDSDAEQPSRLSVVPRR